ncbi:GroES-like protein [Laetiporus sulphureus 93-53]|uniref:GroES-like protein n=1 Tax=Laetiporus sulphureus 93-53 TaxID=1314785 RepID=A0A165EZB0_9APHY|nr:GroES-like protein [Laetiporus sulphureus 93-53]KZT08031.1 GroES-like protein [Laetiporus sulphureus 93-53]
MRAVVCPRAPIAPSELVYTTNHPAPQPKQGHVLIRVKAYGLNRSELFTRQGLSPGIQFPRVLGIECVGVVKDPGGDSQWKEGDTVAACMGGMGRQFDGGYAEYALVPHTSVSPPVKLPASMAWAEFAAIPETFATAWGTLSESLHLQPNDTLLIRGGTTSVGLACAALAKSSLFGSDNKPTVISTTRAERKVPAVKAAGADVVLLDKENTVSVKVKQATAGKGATKCIELVGGTTIVDSCQSLSDNGVLSFVGCVSGEWTIKNFDPMQALAPWKASRRLAHMTMCSSGYLNISKIPLQWMVDAVASGELKPSLDKVFKMEETGVAHAYMEANSAAGKVVCVVD